MARLSKSQENLLTRFASALVNQKLARTIVKPHESAPGFWFGGGNLVEAGDGTLYLTGRYRNQGDSRAGLTEGARGLELAIFASTDRGTSFQRKLGFTKSDLTIGKKQVLSIEGSALRLTSTGIELYVSSEKAGVEYPLEFDDYLKPGTGVWSIDRLSAQTIDGLQSALPQEVLRCDDPRFVHVKDPCVYEPNGGPVMLFFCSHPFCWTSSNTGYARMRAGGDSFDEPVFQFFERGLTWDVAISRVTSVLDVPRVGAFEDCDVSLLFYDGGECVRNHAEHAHAVRRPRGYSCEELGGVAYVLGGDFTRITRLSSCRPLFVSPYGTGCSRYVDVLATKDGFFATWQQSQPDRSQPLVMNVLSRDAAHQVLQSGDAEPDTT